MVAVLVAVVQLVADRLFLVAVVVVVLDVVDDAAVAVVAAAVVIVAAAVVVVVADLDHLPADLSRGRGGKKVLNLQISG